MKQLYIKFFSVFLISLGLVDCRKTPTDSSVNASDAARATNSPSNDAELQCTNKNIFWRFLRTGAIECKQSLTVDFLDEKSGKPYLGALYRIFIDVYLRIPIKDFFQVKDTPKRTIELPVQVAFLRAQLADDPDNKKPVYGVGKVIPKIAYTLNGLCEVKLQDFSIKITEVQAPDLGRFASRAGPIAESIVENYKSKTIVLIQKQLDAISQSRLCWAYRQIFYRDGSNKGLAAVEPKGPERDAAENILSGSSIPPEADKSEIESWTSEKYQEFEKRWACALVGSCP